MTSRLIYFLLYNSKTYRIEKYISEYAQFMQRNFLHLWIMKKVVYILHTPTSETERALKGTRVIKVTQGIFMHILMGLYHVLNDIHFKFISIFVTFTSIKM